MNRNRIATPIVAAISVTDELYQFLKAPLIRKYGEEWYEKFRAACAERRVTKAARGRPTGRPA